MKVNILIVLVMGSLLTCLLINCAPEKPEPVLVGTISANEFTPEKWGKVYPFHYESWLQTEQPKPTGKSQYRKGWDTDKVIYDRLSEYPFSALLYNGWGFGIEYNEPRGGWCVPGLQNALP